RDALSASPQLHRARLRARAGRRARRALGWQGAGPRAGRQGLRLGDARRRRRPRRERFGRVGTARVTTQMTVDQAELGARAPYAEAYRAFEEGEGALDPSGVQSMRAAAFERFRTLGFPTPK